MNNSKVIETLVEEEPEDIKPMLRSRQEEIAKIIESLDALSQSNHWRFIEDKLFKGALDSSVNQICVEKDDRKVAVLQGKIEVLSKYADFKGLSDAYRMELKSIDEKLKGRN